MKIIQYSWTNGEYIISWEISIYNDYIFIVEINSLLHKETRTTIPKKILDRIVKVPETIELESKIFYVLPECKYYQEDGSCKRCSSDHYKYTCNEMWCDKKVENELNRNVLETKNGVENEVS